MGTEAGMIEKLAEVDLWTLVFFCQRVRLTGSTISSASLSGIKAQLTMRSGRCSLERCSREAGKEAVPAKGKSSSAERSLEQKQPVCCDLSLKPTQPSLCILLTFLLSPAESHSQRDTLLLYFLSQQPL